MEDLILISNLNDFIFCPVSIYFHKLYGNQDNLTYFDNVQWNGRKPRIKSDYVNVVLDIGYTMLFNIVDAMLQVYGFDTYYGVFHKCFYMRKSLVCDIMEPIRPIIDYEVRKAINLGQCKIDDFEKYDEHWCLKYKNNPQYIQFLMQAIMEYKSGGIRKETGLKPVSFNGKMGNRPSVMPRVSGRRAACPIRRRPCRLRATCRR